MKIYQILAILSGLSGATALAVGAVSCTMASSGGDDAPGFLAAVKQCSTITIPKGVSLNISTKMDMVSLKPITF
jgi:hypothetical protein